MDTLISQWSPFPECQHAFQVPGLWKKVERLGRGQLIARREKMAEVAHLGCRVAGNVDDGAGPKGEELPQEALVAAFPWRVDHDGGIRRGKIEAGKNRTRIAGQKAGVGDLVHRRIFPGKPDAAFAD